MTISNSIGSLDIKDLEDLAVLVTAHGQNLNNTQDVRADNFNGKQERKNEHRC